MMAELVPCQSLGRTLRETKRQKKGSSVLSDCGIT